MPRVTDGETEAPEGGDLAQDPAEASAWPAPLSPLQPAVSSVRGGPVPSGGACRPGQPRPGCSLGGAVRSAVRDAHGGAEVAGSCPRRELRAKLNCWKKPGVVAHAGSPRPEDQKFEPNLGDFRDFVSKF